ncbi:MAG: PAS domain-containing sensor histidine kinase [Planctomycetota bacterium]|nr:MAG: PAS domain-containing sensor histidine kinase [Planctomycetota bacterium]
MSIKPARECAYDEPRMDENTLPNNLEEAQEEILRLRRIRDALKSRMRRMSALPGDHDVLLESHVLLQHAVDEKTADLRLQLDNVRRLRTLLEHSQRMAEVGGWEIDANSEHLYCTTETRAILGLAPDSQPSLNEVIGYFLPPFKQQITQLVAAAMQHGQGFDLECCLRNARGTSIWTRLVGEPHRDGTNIPRIYGSIQNITQQREHHRALQASEERFRMITASISDGLVAFSGPTFRIDYVSPSMQEMSGYAVSDICRFQQKQILRLIHPDDRSQVLRKLRETIAHRHTSARYSFRFRNADGSWTWREDHASLAYNHTGKVRQMFVVCRDITEIVHYRQHLEELTYKAQEANQAKSDFLASMSHELRTPMTGILGMTELLLETNLNPQQHDFAQTAFQSGQALLTILNDILDFSKIEAKRIDIRPVEQDIVTLCKDVCVLLSARAEQKNLNLFLDYAPQSAITATVDGEKLRQILLNLLSNAIKFTESGHVILRVGSSSDSDANEDPTRLRFEVIDTGCGIQPEDIDHVFDVFVQVGATMNKSLPGTGLGLAISQRLARLMDGDLWAESRWGEGSTFCLEVPAHRPELPRHIASSYSQALIVSPLPVESAMIQGILQTWNIDCQIASDPDTALALLPQLNPHALVVESDLLEIHCPSKQISALRQSVHEQGMGHCYICKRSHTPSSRRPTTPNTKHHVIRPFAPNDLASAIAILNE